MATVRPLPLLFLPLIFVSPANPVPASPVPATPIQHRAQEGGVQTDPKLRNTLRNHGFEGVVTNITGRSITVIGSGICHPKTVEYTFPVSDILASGGYDPASSATRYYLRDVHVGDKVDVCFDRIDGVYICNGVSILRRPGGRVPPSRDPRQSTHHKWANAHQDFEEKGIPLPARVDDPPEPPSPSVVR